MTPIVVLLVEDSAVIRALVRRMLVAGGHTVVEAAGGAAALTVCREQQPDVVLLDVEMPEMSGWDVLATMKADPDLRDIPVVFLTGRSDTTDMVDGLRLGAHDYLRKPCEPTELLARVQAAARVKRLQDELRQRNETSTASAAPTPSPGCATGATSRSTWPSSRAWPGATSSRSRYWSSTSTISSR